MTLDDFQSAPHEVPSLDETASGERFRIICFLFDRNVGGPQFRARAVYERMGQSGHKAKIVLPKGPGAGPAFFQEARIPVTQISILKPVHPRKFWLFLFYLICLPWSLGNAIAFLRSEQPDLVHVNGALDIVPAVATILCGLPLVWHFNDTLLPRKIAQVLGRVSLNWAAVPVAAAQTVAQFYGFAPDKVRILYAPVDVSRFTPRAKIREQSASEFIIGLAANWNANKGQHHFIKVIRLLRRKGMRVKGRILGKLVDGQEAYWQPLLDEIQKDDLKDIIDVSGFTKDMPGALQELDMLVLTSRTEACPMCVLEGMAVGLPQVCFDAGGTRELLGYGDSDAAGVVVPVGNVKAMADEIAALMSDTDRLIAYCENGVKRAARNYSLEACVRGHSDAYAAAVKKARKRP